MKMTFRKLSAVILTLALIMSALPFAVSAAEAFTLPENITVGKSLVDVDLTSGSITAVPDGWTDEKPGSSYSGWNINDNVTKEMTSSGLRLTSTKCDGMMFLPSYSMTDYVFEVNMTLGTSDGSMGIALNSAPDLSAATGGTKLMAYAKNGDSEYLYYQNKYTGGADTASHKLLRSDYGIAVPEAGSSLSFKAYVIDGTCYYFLNDIAIVSFAVDGPLSESRPAIVTCGADVTVTSVKLNLVDLYVPTPGYHNVSFIEGETIFSTDFEEDAYTVGETPSGWWAAYNGKDGLSYGWNNTTQPQSLSAAISENDTYGKVFGISTANCDAFIAMPDMDVKDYIYEAWIITNNTNNFGIANEMQGGSAAASTGCTYVTFSASTTESPKYLKKPSGISQTYFDYPLGVSRPVQGELNKYTLIHLNGVNYVYLNDYFCTSFKEAASTDTAGLGFFTYGGDLEITEIKVTGIFAPELTLECGLSVGEQVGFDIACSVAGSDGYGLEDAECGVILKEITVDTVNDTITAETEGADIYTFDTVNTETGLSAETFIRLSSSDADKTFAAVPFIKTEGKYFYGRTEFFCAATLADLDYSNHSLSEKAVADTFFENSEIFRGENSNTLKFTVFSDFHYKQGMYATSVADLNEIFARAEANGSSFVLSGGDFCNDFLGSPELTNAFLGYEKADGTVMPAYNNYGNHELEASGNSMQVVTPTLTNDKNAVWGTADGSMGDGSVGYYYFDNGGFRFIVTDTNYSWNPTSSVWEHNTTNSYGAPSGNLYQNSLGAAQLSWLKDLLYASADEGIPCVVVSHATFCPNWWPSPDAGTVHQMFKEVNVYRPGTVIMQISGHEHNDRQEILDGVYYLGVNTVKNGLWVGGNIEHYTSEHTFQMETYDAEGNFTGYVTKGYGDLSMGANTWFFETPLSTNVTIGQNGQIYVEGMETSWACDVIPDNGILTSTDPWSHPYITETYNFTVFGDMDENRIFDDADITLLRSLLVEGREAENEAADTTENGRVDICDLVWAKRRLMGIS